MSLSSFVAPGLRQREPNGRVQVLHASALQGVHADAMVEQIVWGWKRDAEPGLSRTVYFSGRHLLDSNGTWLVDPFLFYVHAAPRPALNRLVSEFDSLRRFCDGSLTVDVERVIGRDGRVILRMVSGRPTVHDMHNLQRLLDRAPEPVAPTPPRLPPCRRFDLNALGVSGFDLLAGSGLSYEAGLPMLKEVHDLFWVDDGYEGFCLGDKDRLPLLLKADLTGTFRAFAGWHAAAASAQPSAAHLSLRELRSLGLLHAVFTDNIDRLFTLAGITDWVQVRGSGVVNEDCPVEFDPRSTALLVIGVSADRRGIIAQARRRGLKIVVVNPYQPVSPGAKNLDYLQERDIYFQLTAGEACPRFVAETRPQTAGDHEALAAVTVPPVVNGRQVPCGDAAAAPDPTRARNAE